MSEELMFGRLPSPKPVHLEFSTYADFSALPPVPKDFGHEEQTPPVIWGMLGNDRYGDCVLAGGAHEHILWNRMGGKILSFNTSDVLEDFVAVTHLPLNPFNGADMQAAANYRLKYGLLGGDGKRHKIAAYVKLKPGNLRELYAAIYLFGAVGIGFKVTNFTQYQFAHHQAWSIVSGTRFTGTGHYVPAFALRSNIVCVSWGRFQAMRPSFYSACCDEALAYISTEAMVNQKSPEGFDYNQLLTDLRAIQGL